MSEPDMHAEDAMDSKLAKTAVRVVIWIAPFVIGAFGWFITAQLSDIKSLAKDASDKAKATDTKLEQVTGDVRVLNAKFDYGVIGRITEIERRLNVVEQAQKTP